MVPTNAPTYVIPVFNTQLECVAKPSPMAARVDLNYGPIYHCLWTKVHLVVNFRDKLQFAMPFYN